jgi:hypothetical protein
LGAWRPEPALIIPTLIALAQIPSKRTRQRMRPRGKRPNPRAGQTFLPEERMPSRKSSRLDRSRVAIRSPKSEKCPASRSLTSAGAFGFRIDVDARLHFALQQRRESGGPDLWVTYGDPLSSWRSPRPCSKKPRSSGPYRPASRSTGSPSMHMWPVPPKSGSKGGPSRESAALASRTHIDQ